MGTWALPQTVPQAEAFKSLMMQPLEAKGSEDKLDPIFGDDDLFDAIIDHQHTFGSDSDIRLLVVYHLVGFLRHSERATKPWDPEAYSLCQETCKGIDRYWGSFGSRIDGPALVN